MEFQLLIMNSSIQNHASLFSRINPFIFPSMNRPAFLLLLLTTLWASACTEVIELDLNDTSPRVVIEAVLAADEGHISVRISRSGSYTNPGTYPFVTGAEVLLSDDNGNEWLLPETAAGHYTLSSLPAGSASQYTLIIRAEDQSFLAVSAVPKALPVDSVTFLFSSGPQAGNTYQPVFYFDNPEGMKPYIQAAGSRQAFPEDISLYLPGPNAMTASSLVLPQVRMEKGDPWVFDLRFVTQDTYQTLSDLADITGQSLGPASTAPSNPDSPWTGDALGYFQVYASTRVAATAE